MSTLAIFSPNQNAYSETFIQAHKNLPFDIRFYFNGHLPQSLEGKSMLLLSPMKRLEKKFLKGFSDQEKKLMFSLRSENVEAVLAQYGPTAAKSLNVLKHLKVPLIVIFHGYDASNRDILNSYSGRYKEVFEYASNVIAVSEKMKEGLIALGCRSDKISVTCCAPNDSFFNNAPNFDSQQFLAIGRFVDKKAPHLTILAFKKVVDKFPDAKLKMIGDGALLPVCRDLAQHLGISENVVFRGVQLPAVVQAEMEKSIAFVQHSVIASNGDSEGTPVAVLEAQAAALPVISTYHAGIPDVVLHEQTGLLCEERDINSMAENMIRVLTEKGLAAKLGVAGRERIKKHFTMERHLSVLKQAIEAALQNSNQ